jgi:CRISPR-associated endonuclease/helicase Cas3
MDTLQKIWAKTSNDGSWHPLLLHCLDVAAAAEALLQREPRKTREQLATALGLPWSEARPWLLFLIAAHDLGKACPGFQCKWQNLSGLNAGRSPNTRINHAFVSQIVLGPWLHDRGWPEELARLASDAVGCHHGNRASPITLAHLGGDRSAIGKPEWQAVRQEALEALFAVFQPADPPSKASFTGPEFMLLAGLTSFADWIGSNTAWFKFANPGEVADLGRWFEEGCDKAEQALNEIGWLARAPLSATPRGFADVFGFPPRPLQKAMAAATAELSEPAILLIEAPMGEGKTEAAWFAHLELQRKFDHRGMYIALPTQATGNAMFERILAFLRKHGADRALDVQLLHGGTLLNAAFQQLCVASVHDEEAGKSADVRASEWFTHKKRALLSEYGVGTVDQALLPILPVRHHFVRLWGLANRVVIFDEIHAYDAYTGTLLIHLVQWLLALGSSVVLLSATLPPVIRRKLAQVVGAALPDEEAAYPRLTVFRAGAVTQQHFDADPSRRQTIGVEPIGTTLEETQAALAKELADGGMGLALVNTVQRAQQLYDLYPDGCPLLSSGEQVGKRLEDGTEVYLFHARFPAAQRQVREQRVLEIFGKSGGETRLRSGRKILIATQVVEQSLDLDFDVITTDLAPIDLLLQRAGRLWRHPRAQRPVARPTLLVAGLAGEQPGDFGKPLWWSAVYAESILLQTWCLLREPAHRAITLPDDIDRLVQAVYEEQVAMPEFLHERMDQALAEADGNGIAKTQQAHSAIIGLPDDASWDDPTRFVLYDEDDPFVHRTLAAQTRLGDESVVAIPLWPADSGDGRAVPSFEQTRSWSLRALRVGRKSIVKRLQSRGIPDAWQQSPLLRNHFPLCLDEQGHWLTDASVRLDAALGLTYDDDKRDNDN